MRRAPLVAIAILLLTTGCSGSDDPDGTGGDPTTTPAPTATPTTTTAPAPTPAPTKSTSASTLIDYGDDGVIVATAADAAKLTGAPADFKAFVVADLQRQQDSEDGACAQAPEIHVARIDTRGWAAGENFIPRCGGNPALWAKVAGGWRLVWGVQTLPDCAVLEKYRFPASIAGTACGTADGKSRRYP
jgi:hypothetical protein